MFSGLTNQVSSWIGKKGEEEPKSEDAASGGAGSPVLNDEPQDETKKEQSTTGGSGGGGGGGGGGGSRLIGSVKSQFGNVSSWLSRKDESSTSPTQEEDLQQPPPTSPLEKETAADKEDDNSSATGGADSERGGDSELGTPTEETAGGQNFGAASAKAIAGAKSIGSFFYSAVNKAGAKVSEASAKIKKTVEENSILGDFSKEQESFIKEKNSKNGGAPVPPWVGCANQEALREECLALSTDRRNFVRAPPEGVEFSFDMEREFSVCQAILQEDPNLEKMRFELVPKVISEENFWRNYLYRVNLICQAAEASNMAETAAGAAQPESSNGESFVSEEFPASSEDIKEVEDGLRKLGIKPEPESQEWEKELEAELQDYEMVGDKSIGNSDLVDSDIDDLK